MQKVDEHTSVEELVDFCPPSVEYLRENNIVCIVCGEPVWGSIGELMKSKNIPADKYQKILDDLSKLCTETGDSS